MRAARHDNQNVNVIKIVSITICMSEKMLECKEHYEDMKTARNEQNVKLRICNLCPGCPVYS
jgi:hypothetical protein